MTWQTVTDQPLDIISGAVEIDRLKDCELRDNSYDGHFKVTETRDYDVVLFEEQYRTLREELLSRQQRRFFLVVGGILGVPGLTGLDFGNLGNGLFVYLLPFAVVSISSLFVSETRAIDRIGFFISSRMEIKAINVAGWESFSRKKKFPNALNEEGQAQTLSYRHGLRSFLILMFAYYAFGSYLAVQNIFGTIEKGGMLWGVAFLVYSLVVLILGATWLHQLWKYWRDGSA